MSKLEFFTKVDALCALYRCSVTSWWRTEARNAAVGGSPKSKHLGGWAFDLVPDNPDKHDVLVDAAHALGLWAVNEGDHVHVQGRAPDASPRPPAEV